MDKENELEGCDLPIHQHYHLLVARFESLLNKYSEVKREEFLLKSEISKFSELNPQITNTPPNMEEINKSNDVDFEHYLKTIANFEQVCIYLFR